MILYIFEIEFQFLLHYNVDIKPFGIFCLTHKFVFVTKLYAGRVCYSRTNIKHMHLFVCPIVDIVANFRTWPDKAHIANENIYKLWQFIQFHFS